MCLHYLVKLIAQVLSPYITYFSIQVVNFWHQIFTNCWNNSFQQLTTVSVVFADIHYIFFASDDVNVTCFLQVCRKQNNNATGLAKRTSCFKKSRLILSHQVCGLPVVLMLTPSTRLCDMGNHAGEGLQQREDCKCWKTSPAHRGRWERLDQRIIDGTVKEWWKRLRACAAAEGEQFEHELWLVVKQCCCNCAFWLCRLIVW